jgi:PIN domain nuclease of toxin-antitoxin system
LTLLLDTHAVLWLLAGDFRMRAIVDELGRPRNTVLVSAVCIWEAAIKSALGKLSVPDDLPERLAEFAFERLPVTDAHAWGVRELPPHHNDPFDRLLVAQALQEHAAIVSADEVFDAYGVERVW